VGALQDVSKVQAPGRVAGAAPHAVAVCRYRQRAELATSRAPEQEEGQPLRQASSPEEALQLWVGIDGQALLDVRGDLGGAELGGVTMRPLVDDVDGHPAHASGPAGLVNVAPGHPGEHHVGVEALDETPEAVADV